MNDVVSLGLEPCSLCTYWFTSRDYSLGGGWSHVTADWGSIKSSLAVFFVIAYLRSPENNIFVFSFDFGLTVFEFPLLSRQYIMTYIMYHVSCISDLLCASAYLQPARWVRLIVNVSVHRRKRRDGKSSARYVPSSRFFGFVILFMTFVEQEFLS